MRLSGVTDKNSVNKITRLPGDAVIVLSCNMKVVALVLEKLIGSVNVREGGVHGLQNSGRKAYKCAFVTNTSETHGLCMKVLSTTIRDEHAKINDHKRKNLLPSALRVRKVS